MSCQFQPSSCSRAEVPAISPARPTSGTLSAASTPPPRVTGSSSLSALKATSARALGLRAPASLVS
ncbi:MAG: hypothetical protein HY020_12285 [Burkholderiales bacterium]|nr:hypothetical protein [Burkholderiales bacterium]